MNNSRYKRFVVLIIFVIILLSVVIGLLYAILQKPRDIQVQYYAGRDGKDGQSIVGAPGTPGLRGLPGIGIAGKDGTNANTIVQTIITNVPVPGEKGDTGVGGDKGLQLILKVDPITCILSSQYEGDDLWTTLAHLPKPCGEDGND